METWGEFPPKPADAYYGESLYGRLMEQEGRLKGRLLDPPEDWLPRLPRNMRQRAVHLLTLGEVAAKWGQHPLFCKPVDEKTFQARVYDDPSQLPFHLGDVERVLVSSPVHWVDEYRVFLLDGEARSVSRYSRHGELDVVKDPGRDLNFTMARILAEQAWAAIPGLPAGVVIDVGTVSGTWAVVEANQAWASGLYACDEHAVFPVVAAAIGSNSGRAA